MELRHLRYFLAVAEELHFTRAAQRLGAAKLGDQFLCGIGFIAPAFAAELAVETGRIQPARANGPRSGTSRH